uniref:Ubiquitin-like modifier-activating enzyme ATG7 n=1 Tax=Globodera rostochiensis TaxID=31243 RepID=A0A914ID88_GLORO
MTSLNEKGTHSRLAFVPFVTFTDPLFWNEINRLKVDKWRLDESERPIVATITFHGSQPSDGLLSFDQHSIAEEVDRTVPKQAVQPSVLSLHGTFLLLNTKKAFLEDFNRKEFLERSAESLWKIIESKEWLTETQRLNPFLLTAWADVKNFSYSFWTCVPALVFPDNLRQLSLDTSPNVQLHKISLEFIAKNGCHPFLLIDDKDPVELKELASVDSAENVLLVFPNPSRVKYQVGWPLRNILAAIARLRTDFTNMRILALSRLADACFIVNIGWDPVDEIVGLLPRCVGWERDSTDKLTFREVNLRAMFDPIKVLEQSVELNLKLIRWRHAPSIDLQRFASLRVLLLGSGTLGCNIARALLGWGVRQLRFTFVDYATVSYNNPIRQSLFTFDDCTKDGVSKAEAAAEALKRIYPLVDAKGLHMKIPMPGYPYSSPEGERRVKEECLRLEECVRNCDVLFLVMDSRESRWLPTLLAAAHNKLAITVALGFSDFVIIRHGANPPQSVLHDDALLTPSISVSDAFPSTSGDFSISKGTEVSGAELGCYFCNDVTAPGNSTNDRALDQQCTISRSGISMIASGFATELLASVLQHELGAEAPALLANVDEGATQLGATPHQIRGFLSRFHLMMPTVRRYDRCTACGHTVRQLYRAEGFAFLDRIFQNPVELEQITGLAELQRQANEFQK